MSALVERTVRADWAGLRCELRFLRTDEGLIAVPHARARRPRVALAQAQAHASAIEERVREAVPGVADVVVHTEP